MREVLKQLDFEDRSIIRQCSRTEMILADKIPENLNSINFLEGSDPINKKYYIFLDIDNIPNKKLKNFNQETRMAVGVGAVETFCRIFRNKNSNAKRVVFEFPFRSTHRSIMPLLISELEKSEIIIKAREIAIDCNESTSKWIQKLLSRFEMEYLEKITMKSLSGKVFDKLKITDHFKRAKSLDLHAKKNPRGYTPGVDQTVVVDYAMLSHVEKYMLTVHQLVPEDAWKVIKNFRSRPNLPIGSFFNIEVAVIIDHLQVLRQFDVQPKHQPPTIAALQLSYPAYTYHVQFFDVEDSNNILVVSISIFDVTGSICSRDHIWETFRTKF